MSDNTYEVNEAMLDESEREAAVLRDALAESERLRVKAEDDRNQWRSACADETNRAAKDEEKVAALTKLVAQSSTQYREMVKERDAARLLVGKLTKALKYARRFLKPDDVDTAYIDALLAETEGVAK